MLLIVNLIPVYLFLTVLFLMLLSHRLPPLILLLTSSLSCSEHITAVCTKASKRLYFLKLLKRSGVTSDDLLYYYKTVIRPVTEYACAVWHSSITAEQRDQLGQYSGEQFELSLAKNWILIFLPSYMTFHYLQTDAIDK